MNNWNDAQPQAEDDNDNELMQVSKQQERDYKKQQRQTLKIQCISLAQGVKKDSETDNAIEILNAAKLFYNFART